MSAATGINEGSGSGAPLAARDGVSPSRVWLPQGHWARLIDFLRDRFPHLEPGVLEARLARGDIVDARGRAQKADEPYCPGQWLWYFREVPNETPVPFALDIVHVDDDLVAADKPHFLATTPGGAYLRETALTRLRKMLDLPQLSPVHRLDRDTAGIILFCAHPARRGAYQTLFQRREVEKVYEAIAPWRDDMSFPYVYRSRIIPGGGDFRMIQEPGEPNSETRIEVIGELRGGKAHYRLLPLTGRKHQLRVHMNALQLPIVNDEMYPRLRPPRTEGDFSRPLQLLARSLSFIDPFSGKQRVFASRRRLAGLDDPGCYMAEATSV